MLAIGAAVAGDVPGFQTATASTIMCLETQSLPVKAEAGACSPPPNRGALVAVLTIWVQWGAGKDPGDCREDWHPSPAAQDMRGTARHTSPRS